MLGLGFGGTYVTLFSLPILFASMNFILAYLIGHRKDEGALSFTVRLRPWLSLIDPMTSALFYLLAFLGLTAFNIKQKRWARGFINCWQLSLVFTRLLSNWLYHRFESDFWYAINQVTYVFNALNFSNGQTFSNAIYYGLLALAFGLVSAF